MDLSGSCSWMACLPACLPAYLSCKTINLFLYSPSSLLLVHHSFRSSFRIHLKPINSWTQYRWARVFVSRKSWEGISYHHNNNCSLRGMAWHGQDQRASEWVSQPVSPELRKQSQMNADDEHKKLKLFQQRQMIRTWQWRLLDKLFSFILNYIKNGIIGMSWKFDSWGFCNGQSK